MDAVVIVGMSYYSAVFQRVRQIRIAQKFNIFKLNLLIKMGMRKIYKGMSLK